MKNKTESLRQINLGQRPKLKIDNGKHPERVREIRIKFSKKHKLFF